MYAAATVCSSMLMIFNNRELRMALAIMHAQNTPSAPVAEAESLPLNPMVSHPVDQTD